MSRTASPGMSTPSASCAARVHAPEDPGLLLRRYARGRRTADRNALVCRFLPLARSLARRYARAGEPLEDLEQVAAIGLVHAADRFDPARGCAFSTFAVPTILGELRRHFRDHAWVAHVPRRVQERTAAVRVATDDLLAETGHQPTVGQLAERLGCAEAEVVDALAARASSERIPLDARESDGDGTLTLADRIGGEDEHYELVEDREALRSVLPLLTDHERELIVLRYVDDLSQVEIARRLGVSQMQVSRHLRAALARLTAVAERRSAPPPTVAA